jgi:hypothetical protein
LCGDLVELYPAGQLGGEKDLIAQAQAAPSYDDGFGVSAASARRHHPRTRHILFSSAALWKGVAGRSGEARQEMPGGDQLRTLAFGEAASAISPNNTARSNRPPTCRG